MLRFLPYAWNFLALGRNFMIFYDLFALIFLRLTWYQDFLCELIMQFVGLVQSERNLSLIRWGFNHVLWVLEVFWLVFVSVIPFFLCFFHFSLNIPVYFSIRLRLFAELCLTVFGFVSDENRLWSVSCLFPKFCLICPGNLVFAWFNLCPRRTYQHCSVFWIFFFLFLLSSLCTFHWACWACLTWPYCFVIFVSAVWYNLRMRDCCWAFTVFTLRIVILFIVWQVTERVTLFFTLFSSFVRHCNVFGLLSCNLFPGQSKGFRGFWVDFFSLDFLCLSASLMMSFIHLANLHLIRLQLFTQFRFHLNSLRILRIPSLIALQLYRWALMVNFKSYQILNSLIGWSQNFIHQSFGPKSFVLLLVYFPVTR